MSNKTSISILAISGYYMLLYVSDWGPVAESGFLFALIYVFVPLMLIPLFTHVVMTTMKARNAFLRLKTDLAASGFTVTHESVAAQSGLFLDARRKELCAIEFSPNGDLAQWRLPFNALLGSAIEKDGVQLVKTSTGSMVGRAVVGGLLLGGLGALIGGVTASTQGKSKARKLTLEIVLDYPLRPVHRMTFLDVPSPVDEDSAEFKDAASKAEQMQLLLELAMLNVDLPEVATPEALKDFARMTRLRLERGASPNE